MLESGEMGRRGLSDCSSFLWKVWDSERLTARKLLGSLTLWRTLDTASKGDMTTY